MNHWAKGFLVGFMGLVLLSGCDRPTPLTNAFYPCPPTMIIRDLARQTLRSSEGVDVGQIEIDSLRALCESTDNESEVTVEVQFTAFRKTKNPTLNFTYFLAVTNADGELLSKQEIPLEVTFEEHQRKATVEDYFVKKIPLTPQGGVESYKFYLGLQLDRSEWEKRKKQ